MPVTSWSTTASSNATADSASGISWPEGMSPASVNDSARAMMAVIKGDFDKSHAANGYQKLPNGLIIQWGSNVTSFVSFPVTFPNACLAVTASSQRSLGAAEAVSVACSSIGATGFALNARYITSGAVATDAANGCGWIAVGY